MAGVGNLECLSLKPLCRRDQLESKFVVLFSPGLRENGIKSKKAVVTLWKLSHNVIRIGAILKPE